MQQKNTQRNRQRYQNSSNDHKEAFKSGVSIAMLKFSRRKFFGRHH